jgi:ABC-2 type transport system permease protein
VADVSPQMGIARQILLVVALRWRIARNSLRRKHNRLDLIGVAVLGVIAAMFVIGVSAAFFAGAQNLVSTERTAWLDLLFWSIFLWWQLFPIFVAAFGASFGFRVMLRFPMSLGAFYAIGVAYGFADFAALSSMCWLGAIVAGCAAGAISTLPTLFVTAALFAWFNVTLERLVGAWFERLLAHRRTRELFFALFILLMVCLQLVGPFLNRYGDAIAPWAVRLSPYLLFLPPSLAGRAIAAAVGKNLTMTILGLGGLCVYGLALTATLWRRFAAEYSGEVLSESPEPTAAVPRAPGVESHHELLARLSPQVAAVIRKEIRYLLRNGFATALLLLPPLLVLILISQGTLIHFAGTREGIPGDAFFPGLMAYIILMLMAPAYNSFAYESTGVQTYFTAPIRFRAVLLGKNLVQGGLILAELFLCIVAFSFRVGLPAPPVFVATLAAIVFTVIGQLSIANWSSLSFPRKLTFGQMHGQRQSGMAVLVAFGAQIVLFGIGSVILMLGRWTGEPWLPAEAFALLGVAAVAGYIAALDALAVFAEKKKEMLIEALCR